jgi:hypothetical protein
MSKFKNITDKDLSIPDFGIVKAGETVDLPAGFHNANFEQIKKSDDNKLENK